MSTLDSSWRKVASTHNLQDLLNDGDAPAPTIGRRRRVLYGYLLLSLASLALVLELYALLVSKLLPRSSWRLLQLVQDDWYYCLLVPLTLPVTLVAVTLNWACLKLFKHNS